MKFGTIVVELRKEQSISQTDFADKLGIHKNVLGRYERNEVIPSVEIARKMADILDVSLDYHTGKTDVEMDKSIIYKILTIQKLPEEDKEHIMYSIDGLIQHAKNRETYIK